MSEPSTKFLPFDNDTLAKLDAAHGEIRVVRGAKPPTKRWAPDFEPEYPWEVVYRKPIMGESDNFEGSAHNEKAKAGALRNLAKATVVAVSFGGKHTLCLDRNDRTSVVATRDAFEALRNKHPGVHMASQDDIMGLASMSREEEGKE